MSPVTDIEPPIRQVKKNKDATLYRCNKCSKWFKTKRYLNTERYHAKKVCPGAVLEKVDTKQNFGNYKPKAKARKKNKVAIQPRIIQEKNNKVATLYRCNKC